MTTHDATLNPYNCNNQSTSYFDNVYLDWNAHIQYSRRWHKKNMAAEVLINNNKLYNCNMVEEHTPWWSQYITLRIRYFRVHEG